MKHKHLFLRGQIRGCFMEVYIDKRSIIIIVYVVTIILVNVVVVIDVVTGVVAD